MLKYLAAGAVLAALAAATPCWAQAITFGGGSPPVIQNKPVKIPDAIAAPQLITTNQNNGLLRFFSKFKNPMGRTNWGSSTFPTEAEMPGKKYLEAFRWRYGKPVE
jgi:hypothetical protein